MNIDDFLKTYEKFGIHLGLEASLQLLANLGNPHHQVPIIHVTGSNGKGSVCAYLTSVLKDAGYRVGLYTSPHLVDWCERISINHQPIAEAEFVDRLKQVQAAVRSGDPSPTQFEVITAAAWLYFAQQRVDVAVMEVGLGGRLDATNVSDTPLVSIITSISREHWQRLGSTLAAIAGEKAGILKPGCPAVIAPLPPEAQAVVEQRIQALHCPATWVEPAQPVEINAEPWAEAYGIPYPLALKGAVQLTNSATAIAALQILRQQGWQISDGAIVQGMAKTRWQGRLQWATWRGYPLLVDGAHNPASAEVLRQYVNTLPASTPTHWVMGMLSTKDHADIFKALLRSGDRLSLVPVPDHSSADPKTLAAIAQEICPGLAPCQFYPDLIPALDAAMESPPPLTVLCGSLYLVGYFLGKAKETGE